MTEIVFITSNPVKLAHAKYLCRNYDVQISGFREKTFGASYVEPRSDNRAELIEQSYRDALRRWLKAYPGGDKFFIIEDTSVAIEALSTDGEYPGLEVKYWMAKTDFAMLDAQLKASGNNRRATVRSDLILHLPKEFRSGDGKEYLCFTSSVSGYVTEKELAFDTNPMYPWLDNRTFNKWFVPDGSSQPISTLPIAEADKHDFRAPAFKELLEFLKSRQKISRRTDPEVQTSFSFDSRLFIVCGPSCAGKTTLAEYLAGHYGYYHIEASDFMYLSYYQRHGVSPVVNIGDFAEQALRDQPEIVAEQVLQNIRQNKSVPVIVTGFRALAEIEWFRDHYTGKYPVEVVYVTADQEIRYERSLNRQREGEAESREAFLRRDAQQAAMGLAELESCFVSNRIENNGSFEGYFNSFETYYAQIPHQFDSNNKPKNQVSRGRLEELILLALADKWLGREYFTTTEIAQLVNQHFSLDDKPKSKNNVSRYFNQTFHPYYEIKLIDGKRKYRLSNTGFGKARMLLGSASKLVSHTQPEV
jgi:dephospho-CoA kinase/inosine/xanthosine triphosphate pyrophosphatase family protein